MRISALVVCIAACIQTDCSFGATPDECSRHLQDVESGRYMRFTIGELAHTNSPIQPKALIKAENIYGTDATIAAINFARLGKIALANASFEKAIRSADSISTQLPYVSFLIQTGRPEKAVRVIERTLRDCPQSALVLLLSGIAKRAIGKTKDAIADFTLAIKASPDLAESYFSRALAHVEVNDRNEAEKDYGRAIEKNPLFFQAFANRARLRWEKDDRYGAIADYARALEIAPNELPIANDLALLFSQMGENDKAIALIEAAREKGNDCVFLYNRGQILFRLGRLEEAAASFLAAASFTGASQSSGDKANAQNAYAWTLYKLGQHEAALKVVSTLLDSHPRDVAGIDTKAAILDAMGRPNDAQSLREEIRKRR